MCYSINPNLAKARGKAMKLLFLENIPIQNIADRFGVDRTTIRRWKRKWLASSALRRSRLVLSAREFRHWTQFIQREARPKAKWVFKFSQEEAKLSVQRITKAQHYHGSRSQYVDLARFRISFLNMKSLSMTRFSWLSSALLPNNSLRPTLVSASLQ